MTYAGRNGHPYTSIGRILLESGALPPADMTLERLLGWLRDHPAEARELMRRNRSYIFFGERTDLAPDAGPIGGAGMPLTRAAASPSTARSGPTGSPSGSRAPSPSPWTAASRCGG